MNHYTYEIKFENNINFQTTKELDLGRVFDSEINIRTAQRGNVINATVFTNDIDRAQKVAALFIGKMLDVLSVITNRTWWRYGRYRICK